MKKIVVTPAGREKYLSILHRYIERAKQKGSVDEWHVWLNTSVPSDVQYIKSLASEWIKVHEIENITNYSSATICHFFKKAADPDAVYIRLDDDIVYVEPDFFDRIFEYRIKNPEPFLVYGNIINNAIISHLHQRNSLVKYHKLCGYECCDPVGWNDPKFAETIHRAFISDLHNGKLEQWHSSFREWHCLSHERVSINCISWLGSTFQTFGGQVGSNEEIWLSVDKPKSINSHNVILGSAIVVHFAFYTQRPHLDSSDILNEYIKIEKDLK